MLTWSKLSQSLSGQGKAAGKMHPGVVIALAVIGFVLLLGADFFAPPQPQVTQGQAQGFGQEKSVSLPETDFEAKYEQSLRETIASIAGSGEVRVDVFLSSSPRAEYARSIDNSEKTTQDQANTGVVTRITTENRTNSQVTVVRSGSWEEPLVVQTFAPEIQGVLVIAEGAGDSRIKLELTRAVTTALNIPAHRVQVLSKEGQ